MCIALSTPLTRDRHTRQSDKTHRLEHHKGGASEQLALRHPFVAAATGQRCFLRMCYLSTLLSILGIRKTSRLCMHIPSLNTSCVQCLCRGDCSCRLSVRRGGEGSATTLKAVRDFEITVISKSISDFCLISGDF